MSVISFELLFLSGEQDGVVGKTDDDRSGDKHEENRSRKFQGTWPLFVDVSLTDVSHNSATY